MSKSKDLSAAKLKEVFGETDVLIIKAVRGKENLTCVSGDLVDIGFESACLLRDIGKRISDDESAQVKFIEAICKTVTEHLLPEQNDSSPKEESGVGLMDGILGMVQVGLPPKMRESMAKPARIVLDKPAGMLSDIRTEIEGEKPELFSGLCFLMEELARNEWPDDLDCQKNYIKVASECVIQVLEMKRQMEKKAKKE